jgi:hypothetical protein
MTLDPKIRPGHLRRAAVVYVRQSTPHQVRGNRESGARQYALAPMPRPAVGAHAPKAAESAVRRIRALWPTHDHATIAKTLNKEGRKTAKGLPFDQFSVGYVARSRGWNRGDSTQRRAKV